MQFFTTITTQLAIHISEIRLKIKKVVNTNLTISKKALKDQFEKFIF